MATPKVSIGLPVFNGESSLRIALDSLLAQTSDNFELIISDNASTDQTELICRAYAEKDPRIQYFRQDINLGAEANFMFVLERSVGNYFMWAAADDVRSPDFIELNCDFLENHPDYVCSISPVKFEGKNFDEIQIGDRSLNDDRFDHRIRSFFGAWHANGAFYSLMRTKVIKKCEWVGKKFLGSDWVIVLYLARAGKLNRLSSGWLELGIKGLSKNGGIFRIYRSTLLDLVVPFWQMSQAVFGLSKGAPFTSRVVILRECLIMNVWAIKLQVVGWLYRLYKLITAKICHFINGWYDS
ncbi:MAG: Putative glycosyltransferase EpsE [Gammaproteobacteria bacterium]|nr:MAG: Putative glycosyltransferase EpsE [Gammaproteobacteria bacterium]